MVEMFPEVPEEIKYYPPKPEAVERTADSKDSVARSIVSLVLFIAIFYFFFDVEIKFIFIVVAALIIHELGHFMAMEKFGYRNLKIFFVPLLGAYVSGEKKDISQKQKLLVLMAGPIPGIIFGFGFIAAYYFTEHDNFAMMASVFLYLNAFNLIPVTPLDGGHIIETLFFSSNRLFQLIFIFISTVALIFVSFYFELYVLLFVSFLLGGKVLNQFLVYRVRRILIKKGFNLDIEYEEMTDEQYWTMRDVIIRKAKVFKSITPGNYTIDVREPVILSLIRGMIGKRNEAKLGFWGKFLFFAVWLIFLLVPAAFIYISTFYEI